jgi:hypothetical protein
MTHLSEARIYELTVGDWIRKPSVPLPTSFSTEPTSGRGVPNQRMSDRYAPGPAAA